MASASNTPLRVLHQQGRQALKAQNLPQAHNLLLQAAGKTSARESDYLPVLDNLRECLLQLGDFRAAMSIDWYRGDSRSEGQLIERVPPVDQARTYLAWAERADEGAAADYYVRAADIYERSGHVARAAICREHGGDFRSARTLWSRLAETLARSGTDRYAAGLARFNLARTCEETNDAASARAAVISSVHLLEEAADRYERIGQRERAFDCYQVLIAIGRRSGEFEHVLEGYVNVVRILREDNLRYYALQSYEDALAQAEDRLEYAAGATVAQEMSSYAASEGMLSVANYATRMQAHMWRQVAARAAERGAPAEMAENALLAAIVSLARQEQFEDVGVLYTTLAELELEPTRRKHYHRAAQRYHGVSNAPVDAAPLPSHLRQDAAFPDVWHVDLVEWEQRGSAAQACGDIVLEKQNWSEVTRRRALLARLQALHVEATESRDVHQLVRMAQLLGQVELYTILSPLEHLYKADHPELRLAVIEALERFMYKRTFVTVRGALTDADAAVRKRAYQTVEALRFPHAFDPLARIFRESSDTPARAAALRAIARIESSEAAELMLGVFQHEGQTERAAAVEALKRARGTVFLDVARDAMPTMSESAQSQIRDIFHARGEML